MKKILMMVLSLVLVAALSIGGTVAYLQDTDEDVNVMTLGNVYIEQIEQEWNAGKTALQDFTQAKPLYPYVGNFDWENTNNNGGAYRRFTMNNVVDKYVSVKNTGKSDAYVRTIIALEMGDYSYSEFDMIGVSINKYNGDQFQFPGAWDWTDDFVAEIDGKNYNIMVAVHKDAIEPGETTIPSLLQVYLSKEATNEVVEKLDGNDNGTYDVLVFSQAVQTAGFEATNGKSAAEVALDAAFGDISETNHPWSTEDPVIPNTVTSVAELTDAMEEDKDVLLADDFTITSTDAMSENYGLLTGCNIYGNGKTIDDTSASNYAGIYSAGAYLKDFTLNTNSSFGIYANAVVCPITVENVTINKNSNSSAFYTQNSPNGVVLENCTMTAPGIGASAGAADGVVFATGYSNICHVTINSGTYTATATNGNVVSCFYDDATVTINGGTFTGNLYAVDGGNIVINGGTFNGGFNVLGGNIVINGGTFSVDPTTYVAAGKTITNNTDGTWTVS